jgi:hypothetical protein
MSAHYAHTNWQALGQIIPTPKHDWSWNLFTEFRSKSANFLKQKPNLKSQQTKPATKPMKTAKTKTVKATKKNGVSLAKLRCDALRRFGIDPFDREQLKKAIGNKPVRGGRANVVDLAKAKKAVSQPTVLKAA